MYNLLFTNISCVASNEWKSLFPALTNIVNVFDFVSSWMLGVLRPWRLLVDWYFHWSTTFTAAHHVPLQHRIYLKLHPLMC